MNVEPDAQTEAGEAGGGVDDAGLADAGTAGDGTCGNPPWVTLGLVVTRFNLGADGAAPLPGAVFAPSLCPGTTVTSDDAGAMLGRISAGVPFTATLTAGPEFISEITPEQVFDADSLGNHLEMLPSLFEAFLPGFGDQSTAVLVTVDAPVADAGPCSTLDGVSYSVTGHPEATVTYFSGGSLPQAVAGATATTTAGLAAITGLASGQVVSLSGAKTGCTVALQHGALTGRVAVENGYASLATAVITP